MGRGGAIQDLADTNPFECRLSLRSSGDEVETLQWFLYDLGLYNDEITGYFGPATEAAVKAFQRLRGLEPLGIVGPQTREMLNREW